MAQLRDLALQPTSVGDPNAWWPSAPFGSGDLDLHSVLAELAGAPRCAAWLVEVSNVVPGSSEPDIVASGLGYLRAVRDRAFTN